MYGIFAYMNGWFLWVNVGKYTSPMDAMGDVQSPPFGSQYFETTFSKHHDLWIEKNKQLI